MVFNNWHKMQQNFNIALLLWNSFCINFDTYVKPMKKNIPLLAIFVLWTSSVFGASLPPYAESYSSNPFFTSGNVDQPEKDIEIFPNPVNEGRLTIKSAESFRSIQIMNITGEIVFNQEYPSGSNAELIVLEKLQKGIYLIRIGFPEKVNHTEKIMIK
jgi:hypothetical protein